MRVLVLATLLLLSACDDYTPRAKEAVYNPKTQALELPHPCPDWSRNTQHNYGNALHSNFGCASATNLGLQVETPSDLHRGHGTNGPDTETTTRVIEQYRSGDLPQPLEPQQSTGSE